MLALVRRARQRLFQNELLAQAANALSAALIAFIFLLLLGTEILDWRWNLLVLALAAGGGFYLARKRLPSPYTTAQIVDHRLHLADTLSTAMYFSEDGHEAQTAPEIRAMQLERAGKVAETVDVRQALPYTVPRAAYLAMALLLIAGSLFALRYGLSRRLDLKAPLASMLPFQFGHNNPEEARNLKRPPSPAPDPDETGSSAADPDQAPVGQPDPTADETSDTAGDTSAPKSGASKSPAKPGDKGGESSDADQEAQAEKGADSQDGNQSGQKGDGKQDSKQNGGKQDSSSGNEGSSLMSKLKDAVQNLLSSVKPPQNNPGDQPKSSDPNNQQSKQNAGKQQPGKNGQPQPNNNAGESQDGQPGEQSQTPQDPQGKGDGKSDSQQPSKQPGSGVGNQDGDKTIKNAEALAAMGKISEIIGKRSANITGEATVEVQATSQQLHTAYAQRTAQHGQNGTEISRDEVPVAMQPYVQQYFEQVRKQAAQAPPAKK